MTAGLQGHEPTTTVSAIRRRKRDQRIDQLRQQASALLVDHPNAHLWLFGSWARGDWDAFSDVDLLAIAPAAGRPIAWPTPSSTAESQTTCWPSPIRNGRTAERGTTRIGAPSAGMPCA